jgi:hypothetical protein
MAPEEVVDFTFGLIAFVAVAFLHSPNQLFGVTRDLRQVVISELTPLRLDGLMPFALSPFF